MSGYRSITTPSNVIDIKLGDKNEIIEIKQGNKQIKRI